MNTATLTCDSTGTVRCLYTELIDLHALGHLEVRRASTIEFNDGHQHWEVRDTRRRLRFFSRSRAACLEWEQQNLDG